MKQFFQRLWNSPLKGFLIALPATVIGIVVNHFAGSSGQVSLTAQTVINLLLLVGGIVLSVGGVAYSYFQELQRLKEEHTEQVLVHTGIEFRRGKRTGGVWVAFCPSCHIPVDTQTAYVRCPLPKCGWQVTVGAIVELPKIISKLKDNP